MRDDQSLFAYEEALAGQILVSPSLIDQDGFEPLLFHDLGLRAIIEAVATVRNSGRKPDDLLLLDALQKQGREDLVPRLAGLQHRSPANSGFYIEKLQERQQAGDLRHALAKAIEDLDQHDVKAPRVADQLFQDVTAAMRNTTESADSSLIAALPRWGDELNARIMQRKSKTLVEIGTGIRSVDVVTGATHPGEIYIIAARPGCGKTALALQSAKYCSLNLGLRAAYFSLEMLQSELIDRLIANERVAVLRDIRDGRLDEEAIIPVLDAMDRVRGAPLAIYDGRHDLSLLRSRIRREKALNGLSVAFIDYLGLVDLDAKSKSPRWEKIGDLSRALKLLTQELKIAIVLCVQLGRGADGAAPTLADLRDSGSLEQDADTVLLLHRPDEKEQPQTMGPGMCRIVANVAKNRHGITGRVHLTFDGDHVRFY